jgi:hypothetical protein
MSQIVPPRTRGTAYAATLSVVSASLVASLLCFAVAEAALAAGASTSFQALTPQVFVPFIVIGTLGGVVGWEIIRRRALQARRLLTRLIPIVFAVSLIPDILVGVTRSLPGTTWTGAIALMIMHLIVAICLVAANLRFLPVGPGHKPPIRA